MRYSVLLVYIDIGLVSASVFHVEQQWFVVAGCVMCCRVIDGVL